MSSFIYRFCKPSRIRADRPTRSARRAARWLALVGAGVFAIAHVPAAYAADLTPAVGKQANADLPVKRVVLFSSGVGYFEHGGGITGQAASELRFKTEQINDVLKSLVVEDTGGGTISTIAYPSLDPIAKILHSFQVDIAANPTLGDLLNQLRGAKIKVTIQNEHVDGTILGLEKQKTALPGAKEQTVDRWVLNIIAGASIRSVYLDEVRQLNLDDPQLEQELGKALAALAQARDQDKKPVVINFEGKNQRDVRVGYVVETPVWKTSYRLIVPTDVGEKSTMQGWAIIENQTDNDWSDITLSLVSGRPISFIQDLYQPLYLPRPVVQPELYASLRPQKYDEGLDRTKEFKQLAAGERLRGAKDEKRKVDMANQPAMAMAKSADGNALYEREEAANKGYFDATAGVSSIAGTEKVGEYFRYSVNNVSLSRQRSAMIPIITDAIEVERVSIYNHSVLAKNPLLGARVKNTTGKNLPQGPVTVLDGGSYAGDARIDDLPPDQERLLSFAIDQQMRVDGSSYRENGALITGKIVNGVLEVQRKQTATQDYMISNKADHGRVLIVEHPLSVGWKLIEPSKAMETTESLYRFRVELKANENGKLTVKEEKIESETVALLNGDIGTMDFYSKAGEIPQAVKAALAQAIKLKRAYEDTQRQIQEQQQKVQEITAEQNRLRANMNTVTSNSQYYNRLLEKLNAQESTLETLQNGIEDLRKTAQTQLKQLQDYLATLSVQ